MDNEEQVAIDVEYEEVSNKDNIVESNLNKKEINKLIETINVDNYTKAILNKSRDIILTSYNITSTANKIYNVILYTVQKNKNGHYSCKMKTAELLKLIKKKDNKNIDSIKDILSMLKSTSLLFWDTEEDKDVENDYNLITGRKYIPEDDMFEIEIPDVVYNHITKYKCYAPLNLDILSQFKSFYAQRMYEILRLWSRYNRVVEHKFSVEQLRFVLGVGDKYPKYTNFKQKVLLTVQNELKQKANMTIEFVEVKTGRKTTHIIIRIQDNEIKRYFSYKKIDELRNLDLEGLSDDVINTFNYMVLVLEQNIQECDKKELKKSVDNIRSYILLERSKLHNNDISKILEILKDEKINEKQAEELWEESGHNLDQISKIYSYALSMKQNNKIKTSIFSYMKSIVAPGKFNEPSKNTNTNKKLRFNDFKQREYDYDDLENKLLGWDSDEDIENDTIDIAEGISIKESDDYIHNDSIDLKNLKLILEEQLISIFSLVSYTTWLKFGVDNLKIENNNIVFSCKTEFGIEIINKRYKDNIIEILKVVDENFELNIVLN